MRKTIITRNTTETQISLTLNLDGSGFYENNTGCGFLNHMMDLFARHGRFDLAISCKGDTDVDFHHTVEDVGIALGKAFAECLGDMRGITRYGCMLLPMDEVLMATAVDISGRGLLMFDVDIRAEKVGDMDTELAREFMLAFSRNLGATVHFKQLSGAGDNAHHIIEAMFKSLARVLRKAIAIDADYKDEIPSTKIGRASCRERV